MGIDEDAWADNTKLQATCRELADSYGGIFTVEQDIVAPPPEEAAEYYASIETARGTHTGRGPTMRDAMLALIDKLSKSPP
jgi:hypothetical protein